MQGRHIVRSVTGQMSWLAIGALLLAGAVGCQSTGLAGSQGATSTGSEWREGPSGGERAGDGAGVDLPESSGGLVRVYFALDRSDLDAQARDVLSANAKKIRANPDWGTLVVAGHCDERGSEEYNLGLGARRAESVARYLRDLGIPAERLRTVSFGENRPAVVGHDETAWRYNRRSEFEVAPLQASR